MIIIYVCRGGSNKFYSEDVIRQPTASATASGNSVTVDFFPQKGFFLKKVEQSMSFLVSLPMHKKSPPSKDRLTRVGPFLIWTIFPLDCKASKVDDCGQSLPKDALSIIAFVC